MKVLILGATGNFGQRLVPALIAHNHTVVAYVRSPEKLKQLLLPTLLDQIIVISGNATDSGAIKKAILDNNCDAVVNTAGVAAMAPWSDSDLPDIVRSVVTASMEASSERGIALRTWFLGGVGAMEYPGSNTTISSFLPVFPAHIQNLKLLKSLPSESLQWSMLCPATMNPSPEGMIGSRSASASVLTANGTTPPLWKDSWLGHIPLIGKTLVCGMNAARYTVLLEQNADFIAADLETANSQWIGQTVGTIEKPN